MTALASHAVPRPATLCAEDPWPKPEKWSVMLDDGSRAAGRGGAGSSSRPRPRSRASWRSRRSRSSPAPPALLPPQPASGRSRRLPRSSRGRVAGAGGSQTRSPRRSSPTPRLAAARRPSRARTAPAIRAAPGKTFTFLTLALRDRSETVGSATEARAGRKSRGAWPGLSAEDVRAASRDRAGGRGGVPA
jgi:hypothetical protein